MKNDKKDEAVSPVVGVMLMLVVTIIIAALVATFASGVATNTSATPIAQFGVVDMTTKEGYGGTQYLETVTLLCKGGDIMQSPDITVILKCDGSSMNFTIPGNTYDNYGSTMKDTFKTSSSTITAGEIITLEHYKDDTLTITGFAAGKVVEFTIVDTPSGNSIAGGEFIVR